MTSTCVHQVNILLPSADRELKFLFGHCLVVRISCITFNPLTFDTGVAGFHAHPSPSFPPPQTSSLHLHHCIVTHSPNIIVTKYADDQTGCGAVLLSRPYACVFYKGVTSSNAFFFFFLLHAMLLISILAV